MKKILFILAFVYAAFSYGQGGPKVDAIRFKGDVTTTVRDAIDVPVGETWLVWNTTLSQFEYAESDDIWYPLPGKVDNIKFKNNVTTSVRNTIDVPVGETWIVWNTTTGQFEYSESDDTWYDLQGITDGSNSTTFFQISTQALNKIEIGVDGPIGSTDYIRLSGGEETGDPTILYLTNDYAALSGISNADIDATGDGAIITKGYADANYGSGGVTDGDKGDITVSSGGTSWQLDAQTVTSAEIAFKTITAQDIADATITSDQLADTNNPSSGDVLGWSGSGNTFTWVPNSGSSPPFDDTTSLVQDPVDNTKQLRFDVEDVNTGTTAVFSVAGTNLMNVTFGVRGGILNDTSYFYNYLSDKTTVASQFGYDGTLNMALIRNAISNDSIVLPDTGGIRMTDALTATSFIKDGATSDDVLLGDGTTTSLAGINTDDQTASQVNITDAGGDYTGTTAEAAFVEIADSLAIKITSNSTPPTGWEQVTEIYSNDYSVTPSPGALPAGALGFRENMPPAVTFTGTEIPLDDYYQRDDTTDDTATWTIDASPENGASVEILINLASEPAPFSTDTGVTQISGTTDFAANTLQLLTVKVILGTVYYYYTTL